jgi:hypothetical protein
LRRCVAGFRGFQEELKRGTMLAMAAQFICSEEEFVALTLCFRLGHSAVP